MLIQARSIIKTYKEAGQTVPVLKGVDISVNSGEFLVIAGPSGAGKSTLLHILGALDEPTSGTVLIEDKDIYAFKDRQRARLRNQRIGFIFQFYHLLNEFSVLENVYLPALIAGDIHGLRDKKFQARNLRQRALDLLVMLGLEARKDYSPVKLSGGERQRTAIARALINEPDIILCDEPTGNLDSKSGSEVRNILLKLNRQNNRTVIVVTHQQDIFSDCGRLIRIQDGLISEELLVHEVK